MIDRFSSIWVGISCLAVTGIIWIIANVRAEKRRAALLATRAPIDDHAWFDRLFDVPLEDRPFVQKIVQSLAKDIGVHWTCLRPDDSFDTDFRIPSRYVPQDDLEDAAHDIAKEFVKQGILVQACPPLKGTLREFLTACLGLRRDVMNHGSNG